MPTNEQGQTINATSAGQAAAIWWSDTLRQNADEDSMDTIATSSQDTDALARFRDILASRLDEQLDASRNEWLAQHGIVMYVDEAPEKILAECADEAGLQSARWPLKTFVLASASEVMVNNGQIVWTASS